MEARAPVDVMNEIQRWDLLVGPGLWLFTNKTEIEAVKEMQEIEERLRIILHDQRELFLRACYLRSRNEDPNSPCHELIKRIGAENDQEVLSSSHLLRSDGSTLNGCLNELHDKKHRTGIIGQDLFDR